MHMLMFTTLHMCVCEFVYIFVRRQNKLKVDFYKKK